MIVLRVCSEQCTCFDEYGPTIFSYLVYQKIHQVIRFEYDMPSFIPLSEKPVQLYQNSVFEPFRLQHRMESVSLPRFTAFCDDCKGEKARLVLLRIPLVLHWYSIVLHREVMGNLILWQIQISQAILYEIQRTNRK